MATPHNNAKAGDFAKTVLMPGDPKRSKFLAKNFLSDAVLVNDVRGVQGYTGLWKGKRVSVMASGMGMPAVGIYTSELYREYGVENIIRIGSAGGISMDVQVNDILLAMGACTDSSFVETFVDLPGTFAPVADYTLLSTAARLAEEKQCRYFVGNVVSSDVFYSTRADVNERWQRMGVLGVEMESAALYATAAYYGKRALTLLTVSDHLFREGAMTPEERERSFTQMFEIALDTAAAMDTEH